jgi:hypothetical protein
LNFDRIVIKCTTGWTTTASGELLEAAVVRTCPLREPDEVQGDSMSMVIFTRPDGKPVAINSAHWQTVMEDVDRTRGHNTQIGFSGPGSAIHVRETYDEVIKILGAAAPKRTRVA